MTQLMTTEEYALRAINMRLLMHREAFRLADLAADRAHDEYRRHRAAGQWYHAELALRDHSAALARRDEHRAHIADLMSQRRLVARRGGL